MNFCTLDYCKTATLTLLKRYMSCNHGNRSQWWKRSLSKQTIGNNSPSKSSKLFKFRFRLWITGIQQRNRTYTTCIGSPLQQERHHFDLWSFRMSIIKNAEAKMVTLSISPENCMLLHIWTTHGRNHIRIPFGKLMMRAETWPEVSFWCEPEPFSSPRLLLLFCLAVVTLLMLYEREEQCLEPFSLLPPHKERCLELLLWVTSSII